MNREELINGYVRWFSAYDWNWFATLTFRGYPPLRKSLNCFDSWISEVKDADGTPTFRWVRVTERGAAGANIHFHALVGGLKTGRCARWLRRWEEIAGEVQIARFVEHRRAIFYILKTLQPNRDFEIDFHLEPDGKARPS